MKKRFKLITTIASLSLAVALMVFGVYAANFAAVSFKTNSTVSFEATTDVYGTFSAKVTKYTAAGGETGDELDKVEAKRTVNDEDWKITASKEDVMETGYELGTTLELKVIGDKYVFEFSFTNDSPYAVDTTLVYENADKLVDTLQANGAQGTEIAIDVEVTGDTAGSKPLGLKGTLTYKVTIELKSLDIAENASYPVNFALTVVKAEAQA